MTVRTAVGARLDSALGKQRTDRIRATERRVRATVAARVSPPAPTAPPQRPAPPAPTSRWVAPDPFVEHPKPTMTRHEFLRGLHEVLRPRTYLEVGINNGLSLALSRTRSIGIDPAFRIDQEIACDVALVRAPSDDFFARPDPLSWFGGLPIDFAFIDGMHLAEFAYRDFDNVERYCDAAAIVVFDDMLPRNALEAARDRRTGPWTGDVYKAAELLVRHRSDLVVLWVNTAPTGTVLVAQTDAASTVLKDVYNQELDYLLSADPQQPPQQILDRSISVSPEAILGLAELGELAATRENDDAEIRERAWAALRALPTHSSVPARTPSPATT